MIIFEKQRIRWIINAICGGSNQTYFKRLETNLSIAIFYDGKICIVGLSAPNTGFLLAFSCSTIAFGFFNFGLYWGQICLQE
jgi:hypothetical protein